MVNKVEDIVEIKIVELLKVIEKEFEDVSDDVMEFKELEDIMFELGEFIIDELLEDFFLEIVEVFKELENVKNDKEEKLFEEINNNVLEKFFEENKEDEENFVQ